MTSLPYSPIVVILYSILTPDLSSSDVNSTFSQRFPFEVFPYYAAHPLDGVILWKMQYSHGSLLSQKTYNFISGSPAHRQITIDTQAVAFLSFSCIAYGRHGMPFNTKLSSLLIFYPRQYYIPFPFTSRRNSSIKKGSESDSRNIYLAVDVQG